MLGRVRQDRGGKVILPEDFDDVYARRFDGCGRD